MTASVGHPIVSVIIIFLDAGPFLEEAIGSVFAQTCASWELLLVDDGSTDGSSAIARRWTQRHPDRVRYLEHPGHRNLGTSRSRNLGLAQARGEFVGFLDADDVWVPAKLEQQVAHLRSHPDVGLVFGSTEYWFSWAGPGQPRDYLQRTRVPAGAVFRPPSLVTAILRGQAAVPSMNSGLARTELVRRVGGFEDTFSGLYEDQVYYSKLALAGAVLVMDTCWDRYRQHPGSICARTAGSSTPLEVRTRFLGWLQGYVERAGLGDRSLRRALGAELWLTRHPETARLVDGARRTARRMSRTLRRSR